MTANLSELISALPGENVDAFTDAPAIEEAPLTAASMCPLPTSRFRRLSVLGTLQAKISAAYWFLWLRGWFKSADEKKRMLAEAHWKNAVRLLDAMGYLRGAVAKVGQTLANLPDIAPKEFVETLERLHFDAPPMHWSLLREMVFSELGDDPENLFAAFSKRAFAAASLGQVHRAQLKNGDDVAIKIQYPGIGTAIESDFRNLAMLMLPARLSSDWENVKDQFEDLRSRVTSESDYELEAANLQKARSLFRDEDGIVIPRVYPEFSTKRILTMERLEGEHLREFVARNPSQEERDDVALKILKAWYRLMYAGRMLYIDFHPGNLMVLKDGRVGVLDFGFVVSLDGEEWDLMRKIDRPLTTGRAEDRIAVVKEWNQIRDNETDRLRLVDEFSEWCWMSRYRGGRYDFSDEAEFQRGISLFREMVRKRYSRSRPVTPAIARSQFGWRSVLYLLKANVDIWSLAEQEVKATGWDRSDYANVE